MIVVSNAGPLIALAKINQLAVLKEFFGSVVISSATWQEVVDKGQHKTGSQEISSLSWIKVQGVKDKTAVEVLELELDAGEAETILLGKELRADLVLLDESIARKIAVLLDLKVKGTVGLLVLAKKNNLIKEIKPLLLELRSKGVWLSGEVIDEALRLAKER